MRTPIALTGSFRLVLFKEKVQWQFSQPVFERLMVELARYQPASPLAA